MDISGGNGYSYRDELIDEIRELQHFFGLERRASLARLLSMTVDELEDEFAGTLRDGRAKRRRMSLERDWPNASSAYVCPVSGKGIDGRSG